MAVLKNMIGMSMIFLVLSFVSAEFQDLYVDEIFGVGGELNANGTSSVIFFTLVNNGSARTNVGYQMDWKDGTVENYNIPSITANQTIGVFVSHVYDAYGAYEVCPFIDWNMTVTEDNETNNDDACIILNIFTNFVTTIYDEQLYVGMGRGDDETIIDYIGDDELFFFGMDFFRSPFFLEVPFEPEKEANDLPLVLLALMI